VGGDTVHTFTSSGNFVVAPAAKRLRVDFAGGGSLSADLPITLGATFAGGGALVADVAEPPAPTAMFIGASSATYNASGFTLDVHPSTQAGDILVLCQVSGGNDPSLISGWTNLGTVQTVGLEPNGTGMRTSYKTATGPTEDVVIPDSGGHNAAVVLTFRNVSAVSFRSSATNAASGTAIAAAGTSTNALTDIGVFFYAGRNAMGTPSLTANGNWDNETIVASVSNSISLIAAIGEPNITSSITFVQAEWTNGMVNRVAVADRVST
jgi:hypothetical protein